MNFYSARVKIDSGCRLTKDECTEGSSLSEGFCRQRVTQHHWGCCHMTGERRERLDDDSITGERGLLIYRDYVDESAHAAIHDVMMCGACASKHTSEGVQRELRPTTGLVLKRIKRCIDIFYMQIKMTQKFTSIQKWNEFQIYFYILNSKKL